MGPFALTETPIDPMALLQAVSDPGLGGVVLFLGRVRDQNHGRRVLTLHYEAYDAMATRKMAQLAAEMQEHFPEVARIAVSHRVGTLHPGEVAVGIACAAPHREPAFQASRRYIERLKQDVPLWKKETYPDGSVWIGSGG